MGTAFRALLPAVAVSVMLSHAGAAGAQCCQGYALATACSGAALAKSRWCIQDSVPTGQQALPATFCAYGDKVVTTLEDVFNIPAKDVFEFELDSQTGGAHTGTSCGHLGDGVAYDAFTGDAYGATGFWGYLLSLHEAINDWTGMSSSGWPTDFWADHQSAFPNVMDFHVMNTVGTASADQNLIKAAAAQKKRFYPNGDSADAKVVALDNVFAAMPRGDGYAGFSNLFALQSGDGVKWDSLGVPNPDVKRSEYVVAYMSLAARQRVLSILQGPGANGGGNICNGTPDGTAGDATYVCDAGRIDSIATAHCSIAASGKPAAELTALRAGNYANVASGPCGSECPAECACDEQDHCVAPWLGHPTGSGGAAGDAGGGDGGAKASGGAGSGASANGGGGATNGGGGAANGGASHSGGQAGASAGHAGTNGSGSGGTSTGSGAIGASTGGAAGDRTSSDAGTARGANHGSGCGCRVGRATSLPDVAGWLPALGALLVVRRRRRAR